MADEPTTTDAAAASTAAETDPDTGAEATAAGTGAGPEGGPVPGDPSSEPVATDAQSHVAGRVGPPTIAQDAAAIHHAPEGVPQIEPGAVADAATPMLGGAIPLPGTPIELGAGPYGADTPADESPATIHATKPGDPVDEPGTGSGTKATSTASGPSGSPTLPTGGPASSTSPGSAGGTETADSGSGGSATGPAGSSEASESGGPAGSSK